MLASTLHVPALNLYTIDQKNSPTAFSYVIMQHTNLQLHVSHTWVKSGCSLIKQLMVLMGIINVENGGLKGGTFR